MIFFYINFVNVKIDCLFVEYNGVSLIGGNCKKSPMNIMLILPNGKMSDFCLCNFKCIVTSKMQPTMDISSLMMNWIFGNMFMIELVLLIVMCVYRLIIPTKNVSLFHLLIRLHLQCMLQLQVFVVFPFSNEILDNFDYLCFTSTCNSSYIL